jgi:hypothetical protein
MQSAFTFAAFAALPIALSLSACASTPLPVDRVASSDAAIRAAREVGAEQTPDAALHLKLAQEQYAVAQKLIANGDNKQADLVLREAEADADTAVAMSREAKAKADAQVSIQKLQTLNGGAK